MGYFTRQAIPFVAIALGMTSALTSSAAETPEKSGGAATFDITRASPDQIADALNTNGRVVIRGDILFEKTDAKLLPNAADLMKRISEMMKEYHDFSVAVVAHTDNRGDFSHDRDLSERRAQAVIDALVKHGVAAARLAAMGIGPLMPVAPNDTPEGRAKNRRVELVLITMTPTP